MPKHPRKKQRTENAAVAEPIASTSRLDDDAAKDDEERRLESVLFGISFVEPVEGEDVFREFEDVVEDAAGGADKEFRNLEDADLFFVDDAVGEGSSSSRNEPSDSESGSESGNEDRSEEEAFPDEAPAPAAHPLVRHARSKAAWVDADDATLSVSLSDTARLRKLRDAAADDVVSGREYERRLRRQFEKLKPAPQWATRRTKRRRSSGADEDEEGTEEEGVEELLARTDGVVQRKTRGAVLQKGTLAIERLRDANITARAEGEIRAAKFHPSPHVPVLLTASADRRLRLFSIDGHTNPHLQTVHIPSLPITTAHFHPGGSSVLLTGARPFFYVYDLQSGQATRSPRGLWGTTFSSAGKVEEASMAVCAFDPAGTVLAVAGRRGLVHLVDWKAGHGQVVGSVKANAPVRSLWWAGERLVTLGEDAGVCVWSVGERRCVRKWKDDGGFGAGILSGDRRGQYAAVGSRTGIVNLYDQGSVTSPTADAAKPLKTFGNLTTSITSLQFNHDAQLLAIASDTKKDQMRMIHLPSMTAFANWPTSSTPLGHVTSVDFSSGSEYVAVGNNRGRVLLYQLGDFSTR